MLSKGTFGFLLILLFFICAQQNIATENSLPKQKVILDADLDSDVDDVGAMAMLLNLHKAGTIELKWEDADDAVKLYRKLLSQNPDESVTIVSIGHLSSLQGLLQSEADQLSPLSGKELVKKKVGKWEKSG